MKAEDRFRLELNKDSMCTWSKRKNIDITSSPSKLFPHRSLRLRFEKHYEALFQSFKHNSIISIRDTASYGFTVYAKKIFKNCQKNNEVLSSLLWGFTQKTQTCDHFFSYVYMNETASVKGKGVKKLFLQEKRNHNTRIHQKKVFRPLLGPINFINHSCKNHANVRFTKRRALSKNGEALYVVTT